jgi:hypothetical protein
VPLTELEHELQECCLAPSSAKFILQGGVIEDQSAEAIKAFLGHDPFCSYKGAAEADASDLGPTVGYATCGGSVNHRPSRLLLKRPAVARAVRLRDTAERYSGVSRFLIE